MSIQAMNWAIESRVGEPTLKILLMMIANYVPPYEISCYPKQDLLAFDTEISVRTIRRSLQKLAALGWIKIENRTRADGGKSSNLITLIGFTPPVAPTGQNGLSLRPPICPHPSDNKVAGANESKSNQESIGKVTPSQSGTRIPDNWQLTADLGNYGRSKGLTRNEVLNEAEKFINYWRSAAGAKARKVDWDLTWKGWIQRTAERLGRKPMTTEPEAKAEIDRLTWENMARFFANTSNWPRDMGPEPGRPGCWMPLDLQQQFVNPGLTAH